MRFTVLIMSLLLAGVTTATAEPIVVLEYSQRGGSDG
jgi:hypothetical protein